MPAPGWYADPTGRHLYRWWSDGWRNGVADGPVAGRDPLRPRWRTQLGVVLIAQFLLTPLVAFLLIGGTPSPVSRVGVAKESGTLRVLNVACPGERLLGITLRRVSDELETSTVLWSVSGDTALPEVIDLGGALPGLATQTPLAETIRPTDQLSLRVVTSDLKGCEFPLDFRVADVPTTGVLSINGAVNSVDTYRASVLADTPCQDPTGKNTAGRILNNILLGQLIAFVAGLAIAIPVRRYGPPHTITKRTES